MRSKRFPMAWRMLVVPAVVFGLGAVTAQGAVITVIIDDFEQGQTNLTAYDGSGVQSDSDSGLAGVIGGRRDVDLTYVSGDGDITARINYRKPTAYLSFGEEPGTAGYVDLWYGLGGDLNADLLVGNGERFRFVFNTADLAGTITVTLTTTGLGSSAASIATPAALFNVDTDVDLLFSSFLPVSGSGASLADVDRIQVRLSGVANGDYIIKDIISVPEPSALGLVLLGGAAVLGRRWRGR